MKCIPISGKKVWRLVAVFINNVDRIMICVEVCPVVLKMVVLGDAAVKKLYSPAGP